MDKNQQELTRLVEAFKAKARELGVDVDMADNQDL
jgi:predicted amino acid-binding ACT domain protein